MSALHEVMIDTYYKLIKAGRRTDVPSIAPQEVKDGVTARLAKDSEGNDQA